MTSKAKAEELVKVYYKLLPISASFEYSLNICKQCALIAVDELIKEVNHSDVGYWKEVKQEINNF
jgi:hypothetical protein